MLSTPFLAKQVYSSRSESRMCDIRSSVLPLTTATLEFSLIGALPLNQRISGGGFPMACVIRTGIIMQKEIQVSLLCRPAPLSPGGWHRQLGQDDAQNEAWLELPRSTTCHSVKDIKNANYLFSSWIYCHGHGQVLLSLHAKEGAKFSPPLALLRAREIYGYFQTFPTEQLQLSQNGLGLKFSTIVTPKYPFQPLFWISLFTAFIT